MATNKLCLGFMTDLSDPVLMHMQAILQRIDEESEAAIVAYDNYTKEKKRVCETYPRSSHDEMCQKYAQPYADKGRAHHAETDRLWADYYVIQEFPWGQLEP